MDYKIFNLKIDLGRESRNAVKPVQGESAVKLRATLTHNSQPYNLTDATVRCLFRKPDHTYSYIDAVISDAAKGIVEIELTNQVLLLSGSVVAAIEVAGTIGIAKTWLFTMEVQPGIPYTDIESVDEFPAVEQMIIDIADIKANFNAIVAGVTVDGEVILARSGFTTLGERLDDIDQKVNVDIPEQLADIESKSLKIKNEIVNGNFIDATNWNGLSAPASIENESLKIVLSNAAKTVYQNVANVPIGEKIYLRGKINTDSSKSVLYKSDYGALSTNRIFLSGWTLGQWSTVSGIFTTTSVGYTIIVGATALTSGTMYYDDIMTINLTKTFGAGKEPTETEMDSLITLIGGWFDGEITVEQKAQVNWLLEKIRSITDVSSILTEQNQTWAVV